MANWTDISDEVLEPGKPIRSVDGIALRDNPIALAEGAAGAPKIQEAALGTSVVTTTKIANGDVTAAKLATGASESSWVAARTSGLSYGGLGTYAMLVGTDGGGVGSIRSGSDLRYSDASGGSIGSPPGTWMLVGSRVSAPSMWLRVS